MVDLSFVGVRFWFVLKFAKFVVWFFDTVLVARVFITYGVIDCRGVMWWWLE